MSNELLDPRLPPLVRIVDDDDRVRQSEAFVLRLEGFDVREYSSAEDFLHFDDVSRAGCIVLDIRMPGMNGLELQSELLRTGGSLPNSWECQQFCVSLISLLNRWLVKILGKSFTVHHSHFFHGCCPSW